MNHCTPGTCRPCGCQQIATLDEVQGLDPPAGAMFALIRVESQLEETETTAAEIRVLHKLDRTPAAEARC